MAALEVWFDAQQESGRLVTNAAELDAVLDELADRSSPSWAILAQFVFVEDGQPAPWSPSVDIGFRGDAGIVYFSDNAQRGYVTKGDGLPDGELLYMFMESDTEYPMNSEVPTALVRRAAQEVFETGGRRPTCVRWQEWPREPVATP